MLEPTAGLPAHVDCHIGGHRYDAVPLFLRGDRASLALARPPWGAGPVELVLGWEDGRVTELSGKIRAVESNGRVHVDLDSVGYGWQPFIEFLGASQVQFGDAA